MPSSSAAAAATTGALRAVADCLDVLASAFSALRASADFLTWANMHPWVQHVESHWESVRDLEVFFTGIAPTCEPWWRNVQEQWCGR